MLFRSALKKAGSSKNAEYIEGVKRMYGAKRLAAAQSTKPAGRAYSPAQKSAMGMGAAKKAAPVAKKTASAPKKTTAAKPTNTKIRTPFYTDKSGKTKVRTPFYNG